MNSASRAAVLPCDASPTQQTGWRAAFSGQFTYRDGKTRMGKTQHYGPLRVQRPFYPEGPDCLHFYLLHPPGGLVGGDRLSIALDVEPQAKVLMTTPSAGKIYRNITELPQYQQTRLTVADGGVMEYLPQENIVFNGAKTELSTQIDLEGSAAVIAWEITCLGLSESDEPFTEGTINQSLQLRRDGKPVFFDRFIVQAPSPLLSSCSGLQGQSVVGTMLLSGHTMPDEELLKSLIAWQEALQGEQVRIAITQKPGVCIVRALGTKSERVREAFQQVWHMVRPALLQRQASEPRIWNT